MSSIQSIRRVVEMAEGTTLNESNLSLIESSLEEASRDAVALAEATPSEAVNVNRLQTRITKRLEAIDEAKRKKASEPDGSEPDANTNEEIPSAVRDMLEKAADEIKENQKTIASLQAALTEAENLNGELTEAIASRDAEISDLEEQLISDVMLIQRTTSVTAMVAESVQEAIDEALAAYPNLSDARTLLERCETAEEVRTFVRVSGASPAKKLSRTLPGLNETYNSTKDQSVSETRVERTPEEIAKMPKGALIAESMLQAARKRRERQGTVELNESGRVKFGK